MEWDEEETEAWIRGEKVAFQLRFFHTRQLNHELEEELKFPSKSLDFQSFLLAGLYRRGQTSSAVAG